MRLVSIAIVLITGLLASCNQDKSLFIPVDPNHSQVHFNNKIVESDSLNILDYEYIYNGGGVGLGDFNNDGLEDIFLTGNEVDNALYLNKGALQFEDISDISGIRSHNQWSSGVAIVDINADGKQDIYVCNTTKKDPVFRKNNLYINQGLNEDGIPIFEDRADAYGLNDSSYSVNAAFFDYDNDSDLDLLIIVNEMGDTRYHSQYRNASKRGYYQRIDKLYRNDLGENGTPQFTNVSDEAGINIPGFSLGINVSDINKDGWKDIYISNDFLSDDIIYINQQDGSFVDEASTLLKHTSHSAMGNDVVDINNDGYNEIIALDMLPEGNYRQKRLLGETNYTTYLNNEKFGYSYQYVRNTLQLNNGITEQSQPQYSEISMYTDISATDWSWTPLVADFDQDGHRDLIVTNGFPRDVTDRDFMDYKTDSYRYATKKMILNQIPSVKLHNYAFRNSGNLKFEDVTDDWGFSKPTYSNGAVYGDLDNDGDLDVIINNINDSLSIYENNIKTGAQSNFINIVLKGGRHNPDAIGTQVELLHKDQRLYYEHSIYRGYLSSHSKKVHFGLGDTQIVPKLIVTWPDGSQSSLQDVQANQTITIDYNNIERQAPSPHITEMTIFRKDSTMMIEHIEEDFIDYNIQPLLPHKLSQYGPSLAVSDVNGDGLDDIYSGGSAFYKGFFIIQTTDGSYRIDTLNTDQSKSEELGAIIFDADGDGDNDLFIASGSYEFAEDDESLRDRFFENREGSFIYNKNALPDYITNAGKVAGADYDADGDIDLLVTSRVVSGSYPDAATSILLNNESTRDEVRFQISNAIPQLNEIGMVTDAIWTDYNNDGRLDIIMTRELDDLVFIKNESDRFVIDDISGANDKRGFWNSISSADLDRDGDMDYVLGNIGTNTYADISEQYPYRIYVNDFDDNGSEDALPFAFFEDEDGEKREFPFVSRMDFAKEINSIRKQLPSYKLYAQADRETLITAETLKKTKIYEANYPYSSVLWNDGASGFRIEALPSAAQLAPVYGTVLMDVNQDGYEDIILTGNDYGSELIFGRMDALNGLVLLGSDTAGFKEVKIAESGFYTPGDGKSLVQSVWDGEVSIISGANKGFIERHVLNADVRTVTLEQDIVQVIYESENKRWISEHTLGNGFLSQNGRHIVIPQDVQRLIGITAQGEEHILYQAKREN